VVQMSEVSALLSVGAKRVRPSAHHKGKTRLGYIGGHSGLNLGDDLLRDAAVELLEPRFELVDYELSWHERRLARVGLSGQRYFRACVVGGGTLISNFWAGKVERALSQGLPMWTLGTGAGACGFVDKEDQDLSRWAPMLQRFKGLGVRGPRSVAKLEALGVNGAHVVGDLAFALTPEQVQPASDPPILALNLSWPGPQDLDRGERAMIQRVRDYLPKLVAAGWRVRPFLMNEQDREPTELATADLQVPGVEPVVRPIDAHALLDLLADCRMTVAVRLHAAVLSCCAGVPPLLLSYRDKCLDFMESMRLDAWAIPLEHEHIHRFEPTLDKLTEQSPALRDDVWQRAHDYKQTLQAYSRTILADA